MKSKLVISFIAFFLSCFISLSQPFEGKILFVKETPEDTIYFTYFSKDHHLRLDEMNILGQLTRTMLFDFNETSIKAISHTQRLYMNLPVNQFVPPEDTGQFEVNKMDSAYVIQSNLCYKYVVENTSENTEVVYWLAPIGFVYFSQFLTVSNRDEKTAHYFHQIPGLIGHFPMLSIELDLEGEIRLRLMVTSIVKEELPSDTFLVPAEYNRFDR